MQSQSVCFCYSNQVDWKLLKKFLFSDRMLFQLLYFARVILFLKLNTCHHNIHNIPLVSFLYNINTLLWNTILRTGWMGRMNGEEWWCGVATWQTPQLKTTCRFDDLKNAFAPSFPPTTVLSTGKLCMFAYLTLVTWLTTFNFVRRKRLLKLFRHTQKVHYAKHFPILSFQPRWWYERVLKYFFA